MAGRVILSVYNSSLERRVGLPVHAPGVRGEGGDVPYARGLENRREMRVRNTSSFAPHTGFMPGSSHPGVFQKVIVYR